MQKSISEHTTCWSLNCSLVWKTTLDLTNRSFCLAALYADGTAGIRCKQHESACLVSTVQAGGGGLMVLGKSPMYTLGPVINWIINWAVFKWLQFDVILCILLWSQLYWLLPAADKLLRQQSRPEYLRNVSNTKNSCWYTGSYLL